MLLAARILLVCLTTQLRIVARLLRALQRFQMTFLTTTERAFGNIVPDFRFSKIRTLITTQLINYFLTLIWKVTLA